MRELCDSPFEDETSGRFESSFQIAEQPTVFFAIEFRVLII